MRDLTLYDTPIKAAKQAAGENKFKRGILLLILGCSFVIGSSIGFIIAGFLKPVVREIAESPISVKSQSVRVPDKPDIIGAAELILDYYTKGYIVRDGCVYCHASDTYMHSTQCPCTVKGSSDKSNPYTRLVHAYKLFEDDPQYAQYDWIVNNAIYLYNQKGSYKKLH